MLKYFGLCLMLVATTFGASLPRAFQEQEVFGNYNRIVGGHEVNIYKHPHQISIRYKYYDSSAFYHYCGGSIYKDNVIITAAHCVVDSTPESFIIVAGTINREGGDGSVALVRKIIIHEHYDPNHTNNDIALMILSTPLPLNNVTIAPIALAAEAPKHGAKAITSGWGDTSFLGYASDILLEVEVPIINNERCDKLYEAYFGSSQITNSMICAGIEGVGGKDACQGDSGGPLLVNNQLAGVVSWGIRCALPQYPGVYTNVALFRNWIESTIKEYA